MRRYRMTLTMLSPVHIGTGEEIDPTQYIIREEDEEAIFFEAIDFPAFLADLDDRLRDEFHAAIDQGGTVYLRKFVREHYNPRQHLRWRANANPDLFEAYLAGLERDDAQLLVHPMIRDPASGRAYLPGSSIKGALRTAWVSKAAGEYRNGDRLERIDTRDFEPEVLGYMDRSRYRPRAEIRADPFRAVRVGDAPLCDNSNAVDPVRICRKVNRPDLPDPGGIQMYYDATFGLVDDERITAAGELGIDTRLAETRVDDRKWSFDRCVAGGVDAEGLLAACNAFYEPKLREEHEAFFAGDPELCPIGERLLELAAGLSGNEALIRLGRFSHFECVTVDRYRRSPRRGAGNTRSLSCGQVPLGWAAIRLDLL